MSVIAGDPFKIATPKPGSHLIIGYLDGVHLGHQALVKYAIERSVTDGGYPAAFSFNGKLYTKSIPTNGLLTTSNEKCRLLLKYGLEYIFLADFTDALRNMEPENFVSLILKDRLKAASIVIGPTFTFGKGGIAGTFDLEIFCAKEGISCTIIPEVAVDGMTVSSSVIRNMLFNGQVKNATMFLGRFYSLTGKVVKGSGVGKKLGYPTANLQIEDPLKLVPQEGVYGCWCEFNGKRRVCAVSIGTRPTFLGVNNSLEAHILDFNGELYGQKITIEFVFKVRNQIQFANKYDLSKQITEDIRIIRSEIGGIDE